MGFRFRKSIKIMPGLRVNIGKNGVTSYSVGGKGATINISKKGVRKTFSLPGTGISYTENIPHKPSTNYIHQSEIKQPVNNSVSSNIFSVSIIIAIVIGLVTNSIVLSLCLAIIVANIIVFIVEMENKDIQDNQDLMAYQQRNNKENTTLNNQQNKADKDTIPKFIRVNCIKCNALIFKETADKTEAVCMSCFNNKSAKKEIGKQQTSDSIKAESSLLTSAKLRREQFKAKILKEQEEYKSRNL